MERRLIAQLKLYPDLFKDTDPSALIERAYEVQGDRIAYVQKDEWEQNEKRAGTVREEHERFPNLP